MQAIQPKKENVKIIADERRLLNIPILAVQILTQKIVGNIITMKNFMLDPHIDHTISVRGARAAHGQNDVSIENIVIACVLFVLFNASIGSFIF